MKNRLNHYRSDSYERYLVEYQGTNSPNPTAQYEWNLTDWFETPDHPHRTCISCHEVPGVVSLIRSELMIVIAMMLLRMRRKEEGFIDDNTFPVLMISIIHREARVIQAHLCPEERRLKVRYSQLFDFESCPQQKTLDLLMRWLLSDPVKNGESSSDDKEDSEPSPTINSETTMSAVPVPELTITPRTGYCTEHAIVSHTAGSTQCTAAPVYMVHGDNSLRFWFLFIIESSQGSMALLRLG
ncbi:hypothetical protein GJ744_000006 [Endocarpon pusillum]|uniref:Uncharacterized protein n=1 Tax=Endocarpon pusillum TaxID=364733 RepID=A0A8H7AWG7_9EURO|nr:hypothetical protein GJ744_000006 [Endocarpon pusillum]